VVANTNHKNETILDGDTVLLIMKCLPTDSPPFPESISDYSSDVSSQSYMLSPVESRGRKPVQVEVYPGEFLQLQGANETIEAV
jgi:hypothetical protein